MRFTDYKCLESLLNEGEEIATEGIAASILLLPVVAGIGAMTVSGIHVANENRKLRKLMKKNKGKEVNYGKDMWNILYTYSKDIEAVIEPKELSDIVKDYSKIYDMAKKIDKISEKVFNAKGSRNPNPQDEAAISALEKQYARERIEKLDLDFKSDDLHMIKVPLQSSNIYKLYNMDQEVDECEWRCYRRHDNWELQDPKDTDLYNDYEKDVNYAINGRCHDLLEKLIGVLDINGLLMDCKFVVKGKPKKK